MQDEPQFLGFIFKRLVKAKSTYISENTIQNQIDFMLIFDNNDYQV